MTSAVRVDNLTHRYGNAEILKNVSFEVDSGSFFIIIGPNGSGKTTLLKALARMEKGAAGRIFVRGRNLASYSVRELAKTVSYVPQSGPDDFPFTVFEVVRMGRSPHLGILGIESESDSRIAREAMKFTNIEHLADRKVSRLSGGERQRVYIARAVCQEPKIMLLDEPTAALDLGHQTRIMDLMEKLKMERGVTIVMISHDINLAAMYGDHILMMKDGRIVKQGVPDDVISFASLEAAYGCIVLVDKSPMGGHPRVTLVPEKYQIGNHAENAGM